MPILMNAAIWNKENNKYNKYSANSYYTNFNAVDNVIRYVTRTRKNENRKNELIAIGGVGIYYNHPVEHIIMQFLNTQNLYNINQRGGRRLVHEIYSLKDEEFAQLGNDYSRVYVLASAISNYYYSLGHQVLFAIHHDIEKKVHIHFVVNTINYETGKKYHYTLKELADKKIVFDKIFQDIKM